MSASAQITSFVKCNSFVKCSKIVTRNLNKKFKKTETITTQFLRDAGLDWGSGKREVLENVRESNAFGLLTDVVAISTTEQLISVFQFWNSSSHACDTCF